MKKLLLLINFMYFFFALASCQNTTKSKQENTSEIKPVIMDSISASDTTKVKKSTLSSGIVGTGQGIKKDTNTIHGNNHAIIHHGPNEAKIDSIKKSKTKVKK